jgi:hypothetical protein
LIGEQARIQVAPTPPLKPLILAGIVAIWAALFSCHALAFRAGSPILSLLPPIALLAFADTVLEELIKPIYGVVFLAAALLVVFADALRRVQGWGPVWVGPGSRARLSATASRALAKNIDRRRRARTAAGTGVRVQGDLRHQLDQLVGPRPDRSARLHQGQPHPQGSGGGLPGDLHRAVVLADAGAAGRRRH